MSMGQFHIVGQTLDAVLAFQNELSKNLRTNGQAALIHIKLIAVSWITGPLSSADAHTKEYAGLFPGHKAEILTTQYPTIGDHVFFAYHRSDDDH